MALSAIQVEAKALPLAIRIATEEDWSRVLLLTDCKLLHDSINCRLDPPWEVKWISRKKNLVARAIAKSGMNSSQEDLTFIHDLGEIDGATRSFLDVPLDSHFASRVVSSDENFEHMNPNF